MNDMEKKIAARGAKRQSNLTKQEKEDLDKFLDELGNKMGAQASTVSTKPKAKAQPATKKDKPKAQPKAKTTPKAQPAPTTTAGILTTKEVAAMVGTTPKALRRVLRAKWYNDNVTTNYRWTKNDPILKEILAHYKKEAK